MLRTAIPMLHVADATAAEDFYCLQLGFEKMFAYRIDESKANPCYMGVRRDTVWLHLSSFSGDGAPGGVAYIIVDDVDALHREFVSQGVSIVLEPMDQTWGNREMHIDDPDGNRLNFVVEEQG